MKFLNVLLPVVVTLWLTGCSTAHHTKDALFGPSDRVTTLTPRTSSYRDLISLPAPKGKIIASVYNFRDQTGQYKPVPASSFSTAVTQGATAMLTQALIDSNWFVALEREGLQDLLTERKIIRAANKNGGDDNNANTVELQQLMSANILLEGGITAYESNIRTGGAGARYFGIGASEKYRVDLVTVHLRLVDVRSGRILNSVSTSKKIFSQEIRGDVFRFIEFKRLLELEAGYTRNDPAQLCLMSAIESAVIHLIVGGIEEGMWYLKNDQDRANPVIQAYLTEKVPINS